MMTLVSLGLLLIPLQYTFEPGDKIQYDSTITFEGFIPILGGMEGEVVVKMGVDVEGLEPEKGADVRAASEIISFGVTFDGAPLPFDLSMATDVFPRTIVKLTSHGKIISSDAPDKSLPVRLPGLDVKRFPDITYLPIQFPEKGVKVGGEWSYKKSFGDSDVHYDCKLVEEKNGIAKVTISLKQEYELMENAALEVVTDKVDAERIVKTVLKGKGYVLFDIKKGSAKEVLMKNLAVSEVRNLHTYEESKRELNTTFSLKLRKSEVIEVQEKVWYETAWDAVKDGAIQSVSTVTDLWASFKLALRLAFARSGG